MKFAISCPDVGDANARRRSRRRHRAGRLGRVLPLGPRPARRRASRCTTPGCSSAPSPRDRAGAPRHHGHAAPPAPAVERRQAARHPRPPLRRTGHPRRRPRRARRDRVRPFGEELDHRRRAASCSTTASTSSTASAAASPSATAARRCRPRPVQRPRAADLGGGHDAATHRPRERAARWDGFVPIARRRRAADARRRSPTTAATCSAVTASTSPSPATPTARRRTTRPSASPG